MDRNLLFINIKNMSKRGEGNTLTMQAEEEDPELKLKLLVVYKSLH